MTAFGKQLGSLLLAVAAMPAVAEDIGSAIRGCRALADDAERLACYDRVAGRAQAPAAAAATAKPANPPDPPAASPAATAEEKFGRERAIAAEEQKRTNVEARALGELTALVTEIETRIDGLMTIRLDNGQVWRQNRPDSKFRLQVGDEILIQPGSLNSFILSGPTNRSTRVTRVK